MRANVVRLSSLLPILLFVGVSMAPVTTHAQDLSELKSAREIAHESDDWKAIALHLPDPATAPVPVLELQGDVLRARRFPEDALDYYNYAIQRGGDLERLLKKIGVAQLEMHNIVLARLYFTKAVKLRKNDAEAWNNLAAVEYLQRQYASAVHDYRRAVKLQGRSAVFHSNLGIAYFDEKDYESSGREIRTALRLNPKVFEDSNTSGVSAHVLTSDDRARFCFEMAKAYARTCDVEAMLHALGLSSEAGFDVLSEMAKDSVLTKYRRDPRVLLLVRNAKAIRTSRSTIASNVGIVPPLGESGR